MASSLRMAERCCRSFALACKLPKARGVHLLECPPSSSTSRPLQGCIPLSKQQCFHEGRKTLHKGILLSTSESRPSSRRWTIGNGSNHWNAGRRATFAQFAVATEVPASSEEAETKGESILLDVSGMMCGGCAASVRRTLATDSRVAQAAVNLLTGTAFVQLQGGLSQETGEALAETLTKSGFPTNIRRHGDASAATNHRETVSKQRKESLKETTVQLVVAWSLVAVCLSHHTGHLLHGLGFHQFAHGKRVGACWCNWR